MLVYLFVLSGYVDDTKLAQERPFIRTRIKARDANI